MHSHENGNMRYIWNTSVFMVIRRMITNNMERQGPKLSKSISDSFLLGCVLAPANNQRKRVVTAELAVTKPF